MLHPRPPDRAGAAVPCPLCRPLLITWRWQVARLAGLLSLLPAEVDVEGRLKAALAHNIKPPAPPLQADGALPASLLHGTGLQALPPPHVAPPPPAAMQLQQRPSSSDDGNGY